MLKFTVLIENTSKSELVCEHGLSFWIEYEDKKILLDAGSSDAFIENAGALEINLKESDFCVLSHAHYDHSTGFVRYLNENRGKKIYALKGIDGKYLSANDGMHEIGVPKELIHIYRKNLILINQATQLDEGIYLIPSKSNEDAAKKAKLYKKECNEIILDDFSHETSLVFETEKGLVIFNSCSHAGVKNIIEEVKAVLKQPIYAFVGGLHMKGKINGEEVCIYSDEELKTFSNYILSENINVIYTGHCTGNIAYRKLEEHLKEVLKPLSTGLVVEL